MWPFSKKKKGGTVSAPPKRRATHFATVSRGGRNYVVFYDAVGDIIEELLETAFILAMTLDDFNEYGWDYPTEAEALAYADEVAAAEEAGLIDTASGQAEIGNVVEQSVTEAPDPVVSIPTPIDVQPVEPTYVPPPVSEPAPESAYEPPTRTASSNSNKLARLKISRIRMSRIGGDDGGGGGDD